MATFRVISESNVRQLGPLSAGPVRPGRGGGAVSELGKLEDGYFSCRFRKQGAAGSRQHQSCSSSTSTPAGEGACSVSVLHCHGVLVWQRAVFSTGLAKDYF